MKTYLKKIALALQQKEFSILIFIVFFFLVCYPFALELKTLPLIFIFKYYFVVWAALVAILFISNNYADSE